VRTHVAVLLSTAAIAPSACESPTEPLACIAIAKAGLTAVVTDAATGEPLCDAAVAITSGSFREVLHALPPAGSCSYSGAYERPGVYAVEATRSGYQAANAGPFAVEMSREPCPHVITRSATVPLRKSP
jgi:hypothetical protein